MDENALSVAAAIESCDAQAELAYRNWNDRRKQAGALAFGFWLVVALTVGVFVRDMQVNPLWYALSAAAAFLVYATWLYGQWSAGEFDRQTMAHYRAQSQALLANPKHVMKPFPYSAEDSKFTAEHAGIAKFLINPAPRVHLLIAAVFLGISLLFSTGTMRTREQASFAKIESAAQAAEAAAKAAVTRMDQMKAEFDAFKKEAAEARSAPSSSSSSGGSSRRRRGSRPSSSPSSTSSTPPPASPNQ